MKRESKETSYVYVPPTTSPFYRHIVSPVCDRVCEYLPVWLTPSHITVGGLIFAIAAVVAVQRGHFIAGGALWAAYSLCDNLDGKQARHKKLASAAGEFLDHAVDSAVSSLLSILFVSLFVPTCYASTSISLSHFTSGARLSHHTSAYLIVLGLSQIPFYIGCWAYHVLGRLVLGGQTEPGVRDWVTVDEINLLVVPLIALLRSWFPWLFLHKIGESPLHIIIGHDCSPPYGFSLTCASLFSAVAIVWTCCNSISIGCRIWSSVHGDYPLALGIYCAIVLLLPVPMYIVLPLFTWLCCCAIFDKGIQSYFQLPAISHSRRDSRQQDRLMHSKSKALPEYLALLPPVLSWQVRKAYPLSILGLVSLSLHLVERFAPLALKPITMSSLCLLICCSAGVVLADVSWLLRAEKVRCNYQTPPEGHEEAAGE